MPRVSAARCQGCVGISSAVTYTRTPRPTNEPPPVSGCRWLPLTHGMFALVDEGVFDAVSGRPWQYHKDHVAYVDTIRKTSVLLHRVIMDAKPGEIVDHRNRDVLDNRRSNLRIATKAQNNANSAPRARNKTGIKGAYWDARRCKWRATITVNKRQLWLGYFDSAVEAGLAYDRAAREAFGEFAFVNFPAAT